MFLLPYSHARKVIRVLHCHGHEKIFHSSSKKLRKWTSSNSNPKSIKSPFLRWTIRTGPLAFITRLSPWIFYHKLFVRKFHFLIQWWGVLFFDNLMRYALYTHTQASKYYFEEYGFGLLRGLIRIEMVIWSIECWSPPFVELIFFFYLPSWPLSGASSI